MNDLGAWYGALGRKGTEGQCFCPGDLGIVPLRPWEPRLRPGRGRWAITGGQESAAGLPEDEGDLPVTKGPQSRTLPIIT